LPTTWNTLEPGIPFIDRARAEWERRVDERHAAEKAAVKAALELEARRREADLKQVGLALSDGRYRLVKED
jgi:hypothetical protein